MTFGPAPILDFDGTIADLCVDWDGLRERLGVVSIDDLWETNVGWEAVTTAEVAAAATARPHESVLRRLTIVKCFAVLTSNDSVAVRTFFARFPEHSLKLATVVGRAEMGGPKRTFAYFRRGLDACIRGTQDARGDALPVFVGNARYELEFARLAGVLAVDAVALPNLDGDIAGVCHDN